MADPLDDLVRRWTRNPDAATTIALCDALSEGRPGPASPAGVDRLVEQVAETAVRRHARDVGVLVAVARMYVESGRLPAAQSVLIGAAREAPRDPRVYRCLGEVLLRRGDAERAEKTLQRAVQFGSEDPSTQLWLERAHGFRPLQTKGGMDAVAGEVARLAAMGSSMSTMSELATQPRAFLPPGSNPPRGPERAATGDASAAPVARTRPGPESYRVTGALPTAPPVPAHVRQAVDRFAAVHAHVGAGPSAPEGPMVPHPRDVLEALTTAGLFEPEAAATPAAWDKARSGPRGKGAAVIVAGMGLFLAASGAVYAFSRHRRAQEHLAAEAILAQVEMELHEARPDVLPDEERQLARAFQLESRSARAALDWARERALVGLLKGGADVAFEDAMIRAKELRVPEGQMAFAQVASFLFQNDTAGAAAVLPRWDGPAANDPWYQLIAGATLERAGDGRAVPRYVAASGLDPQLFAAQVSQARATALDGEATAAMRLATALRERAPDRAEPIALVALAWGRDAERDSAAPPPEVDLVALRATELPQSLRFVPFAVRALRAADRRATGEARAAVQEGLSVADSPGAAVWLGALALPLGDDALARKAALTALQLSAGYPPARALAARVALHAGRLDEALKATEELDPGSLDVAIVRAAVAYEHLDADGLARALAAVAPELRKAGALAALARAGEVLAGNAGLDGAKIMALAQGEAPWSDLEAIDAALDLGDLATADKIAAAWGGGAAADDAGPLRALRLARLDRYEGRLDAADALGAAALEHGPSTGRAVSERVFELVARGRSAEVPSLLSRYPLAVGPLAPWLGAYAAASGGSVDAAKGKLAVTDPPSAAAPFEVRLVAAVALAASKDRRRAAEEVKALLATGALDPDLVAAATALGLRRVDHGRRRPTYE